MGERNSRMNCRISLGSPHVQSPSWAASPDDPKQEIPDGVPKNGQKQHMDGLNLAYNEEPNKRNQKSRESLYIQSGIVKLSFITDAVGVPSICMTRAGNVWMLRNGIPQKSKACEFAAKIELNLKISMNEIL